MSSIRETAERIAKEWIAKWDQDDDPLVEAIEQALRAERERAAKIAWAHPEIAAAIRKED